MYFNFFAEMRTFIRGHKTYASILDTVGNTPIVRMNNMTDQAIKDRKVTVYAKLEYFNPMSSVKDRLALAVIEDAERNGKLKPGQTVVDGTSGNTGIALAMVCAQKKYPCVITMSESFSVERRKIMRMLGAKVILTPAKEKGSGMVKKAKELSEKHGWFLPAQFENEANVKYHSQTTGPEILQAFSSIPLHYFVTGYGTGGTYTGVGRVLRKASPNTKIVLCEPTVAPLLTSGEEQVRFEDGSPKQTHPAFNPHSIQGWTPDFIPKLAEMGRTEKLFDELKLIDPKDAIKTSKLLASQEGIFTGISGGATMSIALEIAKTAPKGSNILAMVPDTAERYLSTPLFADIEADMNEAEKAISKSTPNFIL